jgi:hypothetical protein
MAAWTDCRLADVGRDAATAICERARQRGQIASFQGHWGFQYYMELHGARPFELKQDLSRPGDAVVLPGNNTNVRGVDPRKYTFPPAEQLPVATPCSFLATMNKSAGAGFYSKSWGPVPIAFGRPSPETYLVAIRNE